MRANGLFRNKRGNGVAAVLLNLNDGMVIFENPWTSAPLQPATRSWLRALPGLDTDMSYFNVGEPIAARVGKEIARIREIDAAITLT